MRATAWEVDVQKLSRESGLANEVVLLAIFDLRGLRLHWKQFRHNLGKTKQPPSAFNLC